MELLKLILVFTVIIVMLKIRLPLFAALLGGSAAAGILFQMAPMKFAETVGRSVIEKNTISMVTVIYLMMLLQKLMEHREMLKHSEESISGILNNQRLCVGAVPTLIGILPAPNAVMIAGAMIEPAAAPYFDRGTLAFLASWYRHIAESSLPMFTTVLLGLALTGIPAGRYLLYMIPCMIVMFLVPYVIYLRKVPKNRQSREKGSCHYGELLKQLFLNLWPVPYLLFLIFGLKFSTVLAGLTAVITLVLVYRFPFGLLKEKAAAAFNPKILLSIVFVMTLKEVLMASQAMDMLPSLFRQLPVPVWLTFAMIFLFATIVGGLQTSIGLFMVLALESVPEAGLPLFVLLMSFGHLGSQLSPTHVCLTISCEYFHVALGDLMKRAVLPAAVCSVFFIAYYLLLVSFH